MAEITLSDLAASIDKLAIMVQTGFMEMDEKMAKKSDLAALTERLDRFEQYVEKRFDAIDIELRSIRADIKQLAKNQMIMEHDISNLDKRITRLERKAGMKSIV